MGDERGLPCGECDGDTGHDPSCKTAYRLFQAALAEGDREMPMPSGFVRHTFGPGKPVTDTQPVADVSEQKPDYYVIAQDWADGWWQTDTEWLAERIERRDIDQRAAGMREAVAELRPFLFHPETCDSQHELNDGWHTKPCNCGYEETLDRLEGRDG